MNLYQISDQYDKALAELNDMDLPDEVVADTLEALEGELVDKGRNVAMFIKNMEADVTAINTAAKAMKERANTLNRRVDWLKAILLDTMRKHDLTEISCPWFVIKPRKNPPSVLITNESVLSKKYKVETIDYNINKKLIAADIKLGALVNGAEMKQGWRLDIK